MPTWFLKLCVKKVSIPEFYKNPLRAKPGFRLRTDLRKSDLVIFLTCFSDIEWCTFQRQQLCRCAFSQRQNIRWVINVLFKKWRLGPDVLFKKCQIFAMWKIMLFKKWQPDCASLLQRQLFELTEKNGIYQTQHSVKVLFKKRSLDSWNYVSKLSIPEFCKNPLRTKPGFRLRPNLRKSELIIFLDVFFIHCMMYFSKWQLLAMWKIMHSKNRNLTKVCQKKQSHQIALTHVWKRKQLLVESANS